MSAPPDSTFTDPEQRIADLERQLAERTAERDEGLVRETATAEVLQVINSSPGNLTPVFDAILEKAMLLCDAAFGVMHKYNSGSFYPLALRGVPPAYSELLLREPLKFEPDTALGRIESGEDIISSADAAEDYAQAAPLIRTLQEVGGIRSVVFVSLRKDGVLLGVLIAYRQEARPFTDKQIALLENFAAQAVIAMENARLITETREALEQQTATAEVLQVINSSPGDLTPVFDAMLVKALRLCEGAYGNLLVFDGRSFSFAAVQGEPGLVEHMRRRGPFEPMPGTALSRIVEGEDAAHIADILKSHAYSTNPLFRELVDIGGYRSMFEFALRKEKALLGVIAIFRREAKPFTEKQITLLQNFAAQAVIAMENARLLGELQRRTEDLRESLEYQTATSDVLKVISRTEAKLESALETLLETAARICAADQGAIHQLHDRLHFVSASFGTNSEYRDYVARNPIAPSRGTAIGRMALEHRVVHIEDVLADPEYNGSEFQRLAGFRSVLAVPLLREDILIGSILLTRARIEPFTDRQIELVRTFADQAVIAIENARLLHELRQRTDEIAELNRGLEARVADQVEELGRVGRLKRFLAPQLAELIVSHGDEKILESHRREIVVVFCDLRGYTAFTETAEPEEVLEFLRQYHGALGPLVSQFEGTLDQFEGDGIMVFFNDPLPCPDPAERAVKMAMAMREAAGQLIAVWRRHGWELGFGAGIAQGYATLGQIGFSDRSGYTAIGTVCNLASRLCSEAKDGQILVSSRIAEAVGAIASLEDLGNLDLRGLRRPVAAFNVAQGTGAPDARPNMAVVASEPGA